METLTKSQLNSNEREWEATWTVYDFNDSKMDELVTHWMGLTNHICSKYQ